MKPSIFQIPYAEIRFKIEDLRLALDKCDIGSGDVDFKLEKSFVLNYILKPFAYLPASFLHDAVCNAIAEPLTSLRHRFAM
jgi:hypothetical protein